jgi:zinc protease
MRCLRFFWFFILLVCAWLSAFFIAAQNQPAYYHAFTLENGLSVFVLEDPQDALVRVELCVRAGYSAQTAQTAGFFSLFSRLFFTTAADSPLKLSADIPGISGIETACLSDSARYRFSVPPGMSFRALSMLAECASFPSFPDAAIARELSRMKNEVMSYAMSVEGFINSAIDSRVFWESPWKHDSGVYPAVFSAATPFAARNTLSAVAKEWYVPQNAALFITGAMSASEAEEQVKRAFASWKRQETAAKTEEGERVQAALQEQGKKFVLVSNSLSSDFNQIVVQYSAQSKIISSLASLALESSGVFEKFTLEKNLGVPSSDYAAVSAAHKTGLSRVIVQALLGTKADPSEQAALVLRIIEQTAREESFVHTAIPRARALLLDEHASAFDSPQNLSRALISAWEETNGDLEFFFTESKKIAFESAESAASVFSSNAKKDEPFVFLLMNTSAYNRYRTQLEKGGFALVTERNASWYTRELYKTASAASNAASSAEDLNQDGVEQSSQRYFKANIEKFRITNLSNGIELILYSTDERERVTIALEISGGERASPSGFFGLESVLAYSLAENIRREIATAVQEQIISRRVMVNVETTADYSVITIECAPEDVDACIVSACDALIFGAITPVIADESVYAVRYDHRVRAVTLDAQLENAALKSLYKGSADERLYSAGEDILSGIGFSSILNAYPAFLDASRYRIIVAGKIAERAADIERTAERTFGALKTVLHNGARARASLPQFQKGDLAVKISRRFLTSDIPIPSDGSVPFLVPTKTFFDPLHVYLSAPRTQNALPVFNALLFELEHVLSAELAQSENPPASSVSVVPASLAYPWASVKFQGVIKKDALLLFLDSAVASIESNLRGENAEAYCAGIKNRWTAKSLDKTASNEGAVRLILQGLYASGKSYQFLEDYVIIEDTRADVYYSLLKNLQVHILIATSDS